MLYGVGSDVCETLLGQCNLVNQSMSYDIQICIYQSPRGLYKYICGDVYLEYVPLETWIRLPARLKYHLSRFRITTVNSCITTKIIPLGS